MLGRGCGYDLMRALRKPSARYLRESKHGKSLSSILARAMMERLRLRIGKFTAVQNGTLLPFRERLEVLLSAKTVAVGAAAVVVVFLVLTCSGMLALVNTTSHPVSGIERRTRDDGTHSNMVDRVAHLTNAFERSLGFKPEALRASYAFPGSTSSAHVVVCQLGDAHEQRCDATPLRWVAPHTVDRSSDLFRVAELATAAINTMQTQRCVKTASS